MDEELAQILPYSVYANSHPADVSRPLMSMLAHSSDDFRIHRLSGVQGVVACPPGRIWHRAQHSVVMYTFLKKRLTLQLLDSMADVLVQRFIDTLILPDIRPLRVNNVLELSNMCPSTFTKLSKTGMLLYNLRIQ